MKMHNRWGVERSLLAVGWVLLCSLMLTGCEDQRMQTVTWTEYEPVYMTQQEFKNAVTMESPRELGEPGKIYVYQHYLFINERNKGIHVIDNSDPEMPEKIGFINIPANKDIAVKNDLLYVDSHSDLLVFDIADIEDPTLITRKEDVFQKSANEAPGIMHTQVNPDKGVVVDWKPVKVEEVCQGDCARVRNDMAIAFAEATSDAQQSTGVGGSMARFTIRGDYLYAVDHQNLITFYIASTEPDQTSNKTVGWAIETIFAHDNSLYIGSRTAMFIYDLTLPSVPNQMSTYNHLTACDPIVVEDTIAYVTLRSGQRCPRGVNQLEVFDVKDRTEPKRIATYPMANPHGLGIDDGILFVSEGSKGLKVMDAGNPRDITLVRHIKNIKTFDVIPLNDVLMTTGKEGIHQYDYSDVNNIRHLSTIEIFQQE